MGSHAEEKKEGIHQLAIVAGSGELPRVAFDEAMRENIPTVVYLIDEELGEGEEERYGGAKAVRRISAAKFSVLMKQAKKDGVSHFIFLGKIQKKILFTKAILDAGSLMLLRRAKNWNDSNLFAAAAQEIEKKGFQILPQSRLLGSLLLKAGVYSKKRPSREEMATARFGLYYAHAIGDLDIGQSVVVASASVLAVEAAEGTDETIRRGGRLAGKRRAILCKAQRKNHDVRFDIPTVGPGTLDVMSEAAVTILTIEANKTLVVSPDDFIQKADKLGIVVIAMDLPDTP